MRTRAALLALAAAAGLLAAPPADAAVPVLAGKTVISGSAIHGMRVRVPRTATLSLRPSATHASQGAGATFRGTGRLLAVAIVATPWRDETWVMSSGICATPGCTSPWRPFHAYRLVPGEEPDDRQAVMRPGTYDLYLIADGRPASVTLTLRGLSGRTTLRPGRLRHGLQWTAPIKTDEVDPTTSFGTRTYDGETEIVVPKDSISVSATWVAGREMRAREVVCLAGEGDPPATPGYCRPPHDGHMAVGGTSCPQCWGDGQLVPADERSGTGFYGWGGLKAGKYTVRGTAEYAGHWGAAGMTFVVVPYV